MNMATARSNEDQGIRFPQSSTLPTNLNAGSSIVSNEIFNSTGHAENALKIMESYFRSEQLTDVTLVAGNKRIAAHRLVLSASSDYFAAMFTSPMKESVENEIELKEIDGDALFALVQYSYTGRIELRENNVETLWETARQLQMNPVVTACSEFLTKQLDPSNCLGIKKFTSIQGCDESSSIAKDYALENFVEVVNNKEFLSLSAHEVAEFLQSEDVNVPSEETIFNALVKWLEHDVDNRNQHASELLSYIKLPLLTPRFITDRIQNNRLFKDQIVVKDLILEAFTYHLSHECTESLLQSGRTRPRKSTMDVLLALSYYYDSVSPLPVEAFFLRANVWKNWTTIPDKRQNFGAVFYENELFVVGGHFNIEATNSVGSFDFSNGLWKDRPPMTSCRDGAGVAVLDGLLYVVGGWDNKKHSKTVERWNPASRKWSSVSPMLTERSHAGAAVVNNKLYVVGGWNDSGELNTVECYDPRRDEWTYCSPMLKARTGVGLGVLNGYIYVTGQPSAGSESDLNSVERYDPTTDTWAMIAPMSVARSNAGVGILGNRLIVVGGWNANGCLTSVESYDPALNEWKELAPLKVGMAGPCVVVNSLICKL